MMRLCRWVLHLRDPSLGVHLDRPLVRRCATPWADWPNLGVVGGTHPPGPRTSHSGSLSPRKPVVHASDSRWKKRTKRRCEPSANPQSDRRLPPPSFIHQGAEGSAEEDRCGRRGRSKCNAREGRRRAAQGLGYAKRTGTRHRAARRGEARQHAGRRRISRRLGARGRARRTRGVAPTPLYPYEATLPSRSPAANAAPRTAATAKTHKIAA